MRFGVGRIPVIKKISCFIAAVLFALTVLPVQPAYAAGDSVSIVSITPTGFEDYGKEATFTVTVNYTLQSVDQGIVYLGFNTNTADRYSLVDEAIVSKGSGTVTLKGTVVPAGWGTPNSPNGPLQGSMELLNGNTFGAYVNISEYPHPESWNPLASEVKALSKGGSGSTSNTGSGSLDIFSKLPKGGFLFCSGVGAWNTSVVINADGTFSGDFHDTDSDTGVVFPNGTREECFFSGKFTNVQKISDLEYSMTVEYLNTVGTEGEEKIVDGVKIITTTPYGFDNANEFRLYLPGRNTKDLPEEFLFWVGAPFAWGNNVPTTLPFYGLYNVSGQQGFFSEDVDSGTASAEYLLPLAPTIDFDSGLAEHFSITLDWGVDRFSRDATIYYDNELAIAGLALSGAAETMPGSEGEAHVKTMLEQMGFEKVNSYWYSYNYNDKDTVACSFASKKIFVNGEYYNLIVVVNRGSVGSIFDNWSWTDFNWKNDWISNLGGGASFRNAANKVYGYLQAYIENAHIDTGIKAKLLITGHSRGAAVANLLGTMTSNIATQANTYVYTFASPKTNADSAKYSNIINILNEEDLIPKLSPLDIGRYGQDKWFHRNDESIKESIYSYFSTITGGKNLKDTMSGTLWLFDYPRSEFEKIAYAHDTATYLARLTASDLYDADAPKRYTKTVSFHCPVDIEITSDDGTLVGQIENNEVVLDIASDLLLWVEGDEKYISVGENSEYTFTAIGTGNGLMTYAVQVEDLMSGATTAETSFHDVAVEPKKRMTSKVSGGSTVSGVQLFVVDATGNSLAEIMPNGTEISTIVTTAATDTPAKPSIQHIIAIVWVAVIVICAGAITIGLLIRKKKRQTDAQSASANKSQRQ
jgi:hypothetical protein